MTLTHGEAMPKSATNSSFIARGIQGLWCLRVASFRREEVAFPSAATARGARLQLPLHRAAQRRFQHRSIPACSKRQLRIIDRASSLPVATVTFAFT